MKKGLVLEGGAMRGMFTAGILDYFAQNNLEFDGMVGVSAGAVFGCNYKSRQIGRTLRYNLKYCQDKRYCSWRSLIFTGDMYGKRFCYYEIPQKLDPFDYHAFDNNPMDFYVVATDVQSGKPVYRSYPKAREDMIEFMRASASMPFVSKIVEVGGKKLLDGGIADSVPLKFFEEEGYKKNVVILTRPKGYIKEPTPLSLPAKIIYRKYPAMINAILTRHEMYNRQMQYIQEREKAGAAYVLRPQKPLELKHAEHNPQKLRAAYDEGRKTAEKEFLNVKSFLEE